MFVSENIYGGGNASAQSAVNWWMGDALHQNTMLSPNYTDAGVGVASNGSAMYFTLDVGYVPAAREVGVQDRHLQPRCREPPWRLSRYKFQLPTRMVRSCTSYNPGRHCGRLLLLIK